MSTETGVCAAGDLSVTETGSVLQRTPLRAAFEAPAADLGELLGRLGDQLFPFQPLPRHYVVWAYELGLFEALAEHGPADIARLCTCTPLNEPGLDSLLGVLCALGLAARDGAGAYSLTPTARDYCLRSSPFFMADQLTPVPYQIPQVFLREGETESWDAHAKAMRRRGNIRFGTLDRLRNQHARNLGACVAAVRTGEFANVRYMVDVGGGSGTFAIPLALEYPQARIALTELPGASDNIRVILAEHHLENRVELLEFNAFKDTWPISGCDGVFIGNVLHGFDDAACIKLCQQAFDSLCPGGKVWLHEIIWNPNRDGPMITALLNASMRSGGAGRQRTADELTSILKSADFKDSYVIRTSGAYALIAATRP